MYTRIHEKLTINMQRLLAVLLPLVACTLQWLLWDFITPYVWFLFFPAVFFSAWLGGLSGGLTATLISTLLVWYLFIPPVFSFTLGNSASALTIAMFVFMGSLFAFFFEHLRRTTLRTDEALALLARVDAMETQRQHTMEELKHSEALLNESQQLAQLGNWELDLKNDVLFWSDEIFRIFEIDPAGFGASYEAFLNTIHPDDRAMVNKAYTDSLTNRTPYEIVHRLLFPDQRVKFVQEWCKTQYDSEGRAVRSSGTVQDITVRKLAEAEIFAATSQLAATLDALPDLLFELGLDGHYYDCRATRAEQLAAPAEILIGNSVYDMLPVEAADIVISALREAHATGRSHGKQIELQVPQGQLWFELSVAEKSVGSGMSPRFIMLSRDITERKLAQKKLDESYRELEKLTTRLEAIREGEQQRIARELHDEMGSVLTALNINASLLARKIPAEMAGLRGDVAEINRLIATGISAMRRIVFELRPTLLDQIGLVCTIKSYLQQFENNTKIICNLEFPEAELILNGNQSTAIFRIIQETLTNVSKHAQADRVSISLSVLNDSLILTVSDNGKGFDPDDLRANAFGLIGIRERAVMLGGTTSITSLAGHGTTVRVTLPVNPSLF
ncbi:MAG: DUF4118 domain-containing protein [Proteobacteria bacterium]|nr:DUF4118 domain-containing protein [Pseudomonadota bacterium]